MRPRVRQLVVRLLVVATAVSGSVYVGWRWLYSVNWTNWWIAVPLVVAETYSLIDAWLFGITMWRLRERGDAPPPSPEATVDVFITTYNEPVELVRATAAAARDIRFPHHTWVLDDGDRPALRAMAAEEGVGYLTRHDDWAGKARHAKAGNLNNALFQTDGEFLLVLDADQVPDPLILDRTLGWFSDPQVALVQTPQWFVNVTESDPLGSQAPLFYGPIQQGKDGWNAAFFCGSNAVIRRDALMQLGIVGYVREVERAVRLALRGSRRILARAGRQATDPQTAADLAAVRRAVDGALGALDAGVPVADVTWSFQQSLREVSRSAVDRDLAGIRADLASLADLPIEVGSASDVVVDEAALTRLAERDWTPLGAVAAVRRLMDAVDVDRGDEAQPLMPLATVSVTEDMATCMRLHAQGWRTVYHHEVLAHGLAPEDLGSMLQQRLRWAQGTLQVMLRENPLAQRGLSLGQRLMYFATMWSYLSGFTAVVYIAAPVVYLCLGVLPVKAFGLSFLLHFAPYLLFNQLLFTVIGFGVKTWRGHQYSLALFPLWIRAVWTATANVVFKRPLGFVVTPKSRQGGERFPWRLIWPQLTAIGILLVSCMIGLLRLWWGTTNTVLGTAVNFGWVAYDVVVLSVIVQAARYRGFQPAPAEESPA